MPLVVLAGDTPVLQMVAGVAGFSTSFVGDGVGEGDGDGEGDAEGDAEGQALEEKRCTSVRFVVVVGGGGGGENTTPLGEHARIGSGDGCREASGLRSAARTLVASS